MKPVSSLPLYKCPSLHQLSRIHNSIYGYDTEQQSLVEVDVKHSIVYPYKLQSASTNQMLNCKFVENYSNQSLQGKSAYFCVFDKKIQRYSFLQNKSSTGLLKNYQNAQNKSQSKKKSTILTSNSMASFTGQFDAYQNSLIFMKIHENHGKYSLNWQQGSEKQKKILKIMDFHPKSLVLNRFHPQIIYTDLQNHVKYFDIQKPNIETLLVKKSIVMFDNFYLYSTSTNLVSKHNDTYQIQSIDLKTGKHAFSFKGNRMPRKIQTYGNHIFYLNQKGFFIYDKRKFQHIDEFIVGSEQFFSPKQQRQNQSLGFGKFGSSNIRINDFLIEPNLGKIYLSLTNQLKVMQFYFSLS